MRWLRTSGSSRCRSRASRRGSAGLVAVVLSFFALQAIGLSRRGLPAPRPARPESDPRRAVAPVLSVPAGRADREAQRDAGAVDPSNGDGRQFRLRHEAVLDRVVQEDRGRRYRGTDGRRHLRPSADPGRRRHAPGSGCCASPSRSTSRSRRIRTWRSAWGGCSASGCPKTSSGPTLPGRFMSSGRSGSSRWASGFATTCGCRSAPVPSA